MDSFEYGACKRCGQTTIMLAQSMTGTPIEINPLPHPDGYVWVDFQTARCRVVPLKFMKKHGPLWLPHVATCPALKKESA